MVAKGEINPENLSLHVRQQTVVWEKAEQCTYRSITLGLETKWIMFYSDSAPAELMKLQLQVIRYNCKSLNNTYNSILCSCKRYSFKCIAAFEQGRGEICEESEVIALKK